MRRNRFRERPIHSFAPEITEKGAFLRPGNKWSLRVMWRGDRATHRHPTRPRAAQVARTIQPLRSKDMPEEEVVERAHEDAREGKSPSTQAGEFVREEMHHIREGKHGARSPQQAIAIGLSKARRAGVKLGPPKSGTVSPKVREQAERDTRKDQTSSRSKPSRKRSRATSNALRREPQSSASRASLAGRARSVAKRRGGRARHGSAMRAAQTRSNRRNGGRGRGSRRKA